MWHWRGPAPFHFISVPADESREIKEMSRALTYGWGMIPVTAHIGSTTFTTSMYEKDGLYILPIKNAVRFAEALEIDDQVEVMLEIRPA